MRRGLAIVVLVGCGRLGFEGGTASTGDGGMPGDGELDDGPIDVPIDGVPCTFSAWGTPVDMGALNSSANDYSPTLSDDGLELIFESDRGGNGDLYGSVRASTTDPWPPPVALTALNSLQEEHAPTLSADRLAIYFGSTRGGIAEQLYRATRSSPTAAWGPPQLVLELATTEIRGPAIATSGTELFWSANSHIERATLVTGVWVASGVVTELGTSNPRYPDLSRDGRTIYYEQSGQIVSATREAPGMPFTGTTSVDPVNSGSFESDPELGDRDRALIFASERGGGAGQSDLWMSTRPCD